MAEDGGGGASEGPGDGSGEEAGGGPGAVASAKPAAGPKMEIVTGSTQCILDLSVHILCSPLLQPADRENLRP